MNGWMILGLVVGGLLVWGVALLFVWCYCRISADADDDMSGETHKVKPHEWQSCDVYDQTRSIFSDDDIYGPGGLLDTWAPGWQADDDDMERMK